MEIKKIVTLISIISLTVLLSLCAYHISESANMEVSYEKPEIKKDTNMGAELPFINYESEHQLIFSHSLGIFIYDLDNSKMLRAMKPYDSKLHIGAQGDTSAVVQVNHEKQIITIHESGYQELNYYYKYNISKDKLYKCPIGELDMNIKKPEVIGQMDTNDWSVWDLIYTSKLTGKKYYPFRDVAK